MDSSPNQPQPSSSGRQTPEKAIQARIAKREKEREWKAKIAAAKQANPPLRLQQGMPILEAVRQPTYEQLLEENAALRAENEQLKAENAQLRRAARLHSLAENKRHLRAESRKRRLAEQTDT
ncbi:hypothetical protein DdX_18747 [Ditylenchus destructor]|uniref:Uncharacterized protein n=1 Tax=Ditylenchus destructor TaxID=166010 RepID=A0AAD4QSN7_9BILA|nr:hypothetical protein DdX_18747 [Ditylenchus destructor]